MSASADNRKSREVLAGVLFMVIATLVTLAVGEVAIRIISSRKNIYNIEMVKYATQLKMRDPQGEVSHVHQASRTARLMGVDVSLNSLGNRGPELAPTPDSTRKRVLVLGSSITMGWGVPFDSTFTTSVERRLNAEHPFGAGTSFEFLNAGIGNYNTVFQHALFKREFPVVTPDMVVLHYFISDAQPRTMGRNSWLLQHSFLAAFLFDRWSLLKLRFGGEYKGLLPFYQGLYADTSSAWKLTQKHVQEMRAATEATGAPFVIVITPDIHDFSPGTPYKAIYDTIETTFRGMGIPTVSSFDALQRTFGSDVSKIWIQPDDPHPNAKGHAVMADVFYDFIVSSDPLHLKRAPAPTR
jgi:hypothetical protein